jgi:hypothetical protein
VGPGGWLPIGEWGAVAAVSGSARAPVRPWKPGWLGMVQFVGPGCILYRGCTQVHSIYTIYIYVYVYVCIYMYIYIPCINFIVLISLTSILT